MAVGDYLTWAVQAQDAPAHVARILQTILLNEGVVDKAGNSFQVTEDTGANMQIQIGSGTLGDLAAIDGDDVAGQGVYVIEAQNATVTRTIAASDPSQDRIDLVVLQNYDDEADSSGLNDAEVEVIQGTPAGSPSAPALPSSAISLAEVLVGAGVTAVTDANITDTRAEAHLRDTVMSLPYAEVSVASFSVTASGNTVIAWGVEVSDDDGWVDLGTDNTVVTPTVAGRYQILFQVDATQSWSSARIRVIITKNGSSSVWELDRDPGPSAASGGIYQVSGELTLNGTTDTVGGLVFNGAGSVRLVNARLLVRLVQAT